MRIYTRTGDDGTTGLLGPGRVSKDAARVEACGSVDELNAVLGVVRTLDLDGWLAAELATIQSRLFHVGAELAAVTPDVLAKLERIGDEDVAALERWIDRLDTELAPLTRASCCRAAPRSEPSCTSRARSAAAPSADRGPAPGRADRLAPGALPESPRGPALRHGALVQPARGPGSGAPAGLKPPQRAAADPGGASGQAVVLRG